MHDYIKNRARRDISEEELREVALAAKDDPSLLPTVLDGIHGVLVNLANSFEIEGWTQGEIFCELKKDAIDNLYRYYDGRTPFNTCIKVWCTQSLIRMNRSNHVKDRHKQFTALEFDPAMSPTVGFDYPNESRVLSDVWPIEGLHRKHAIILELIYLHDWPIKDIARVYGVTTPTIYSYMHRALKMTERILNEQAKEKVAHLK